MQTHLKRWTDSLLEWLGATSAADDGWDRWVAFALVVLAAVLFDLLLRLGIVEFESWRIRRRLGEGGLGWCWIVYDLWAPLCEIRLWLSRTLRPSKGLWR